MIYPINQQIENLMESFINPETGELNEFWVNPETGESVTITDEVMQNAIEQLQLGFDEKIIALRNSYKTYMLNAETIGAEASALWKLQQEASKRAKSESNKAERTKRFIAWLLQGDKFDKYGVKIGYRKSEEVVLEDGFIQWAMDNARDLLKEPEVRRQDIKSAIKSGQDIQFAHIEQKNNIQVK